MLKSLFRTLRILVSAVAAGLVAGCAGQFGGPEPDRPAATMSYARLAAVQARVGREALKEGNPSAALKLFDRAHKFAPLAVGPLVGRGDALLALRRLDAADLAFRTALARDPNSFEAHEGLGKALVSNGKYKEGLGEFQAALAIRQTASLFNKIGVTLEMLGDGAGAQRQYRKALARQPGNLAARNNLALSLAVSGAYDDAIHEMEKVVQSPGVTDRYRANLAFIYGISGRHMNELQPDIAAAAARMGWDDARFARARRVAANGGRAAILSLLTGHEVPAGGTSARTAVTAPAAATAAPAAKDVARPGAGAGPQVQASLPAPPAPVAEAQPPQQAAKSPAAAAVPPVSRESRRYYVQLGAYTPSHVAQALAGLAAGAGDLLPEHRVDVAHHGKLYLLRTAAIAEGDTARALCDTFRTRNIDCFVTREASPPAAASLDVASAGNAAAVSQFVSGLPGHPAGLAEYRIAAGRAAPPGVYRVQLAAYRWAAHLAMGRIMLRRAAGDILPPLEELVSTDRSNAIPFRLRTVPVNSRDAARALCGMLKRRGLDCLVIRHGPRSWRPIANAVQSGRAGAAGPARAYDPAAQR